MRANFVIISAMMNELAPLLDEEWAKTVIDFSTKAIPNTDPEELEDRYYQWRRPDPVYKRANLNFYPIKIGAEEGWAVHSGIGIANSAATTALVAELTQAKTIVYSGTAGGLNTEIPVGDVIIGTSYSYHSADATSFGYAPGQLPGMPQDYTLTPKWQDTLKRVGLSDTHPQSIQLAELAELGLKDCSIWNGEIITGDSFITGENIGEIKKLFPRALATEMESAAAAQVCWKMDRDFLAIRCISDLCSPDGVDQYHLNVHLAAATAATTTRLLLSHYLR